MTNKKIISSAETIELIELLRGRFEQNKHRHPNIVWTDVEDRLKSKPSGLWSIDKMENTGGEPDVVNQEESGAFVFFDCAKESPKGRRSLCYDRKAWESRKKHKPENNVLDVARDMGIDLLDEDQYRYLQSLGP